MKQTTHARTLKCTLNKRDEMKKSRLDPDLEEERKDNEAQWMSENGQQTVFLSSSFLMYRVGGEEREEWDGERDARGDREKDNIPSPRTREAQSQQKGQRERERGERGRKG